MENSFRKSIRVKVNKKSGLIHLSVRSSEYKVDVYKIPIADMASLIEQFKEGMRSNSDEFEAEPEDPKEDDIEG